MNLIDTTIRNLKTTIEISVGNNSRVTDENMENINFSTLLALFPLK